MDVFLTFFIEQLRTQSFSITLLAIAIWYFYRELEKQKTQNKLQQERIVQYLQEDRMKLVQLVDDLTDVVEQNTTVLKAIEKKL